MTNYTYACEDCSTPSIFCEHCISGGEDLSSLSVDFNGHPHKLSFSAATFAGWTCNVKSDACLKKGWQKIEGKNEFLTCKESKFNVCKGCYEASKQ